MVVSEKLKNLLFEAGLNEAEVMLYLELKKSPAQTKWELVSRIGIDKNKIYRAFDRLQSLKMVTMDNLGLRATSLKNLAGQISDDSKKLNNLAKKIRNISAYTKAGDSSCEEFEIIYDYERFLEKYLMMAELKYDMSLDFGDFESFAALNMKRDLSPAFKFRVLRSKHAQNHSICTTDGPFTTCMARKSLLDQFKARIDILKMDFKDKWIIFSDSSDYVMFNDMTDKSSPYSVLVKSKIIADTERANYRYFSQMFENC